MIDGGLGAAAGGLAVSASGVGALVGAPTAVVGATTAATGAAATAAGVYMAAQGADNATKGYNRGSSEGTVTFTQGTGDKARKVTVKIPEGYRKIKEKSHGQNIYTNGKLYISRQGWS